MMLKAELQRVKVQLAALHGQAPALDAALATSLAFDAQPNTAAAQAAQVSLQSTCPTTPPALRPCMAIPVFAKTKAQDLRTALGLSRTFLAWSANTAAWVTDGHCSKPL